MSHFFTYNGRRSTDYGVTISGGGTYAAPARDMTEVVIPGKNGHMLLDNGRFENITVTYPGWIARGFDGKIDAFRAFLASDPGYKRLEDTYHPDEFRLAAFRSGFDPDTGPLNRSGRFDVVFDCLPERWLKSGEAWTPEVLSCGNVAILNPSGGGEVDSGWISSPVFKKSASYDITLKAVPLPGHTMSELTSVMVDGDYYAIYLTSNSPIVQATSTILPSLVATGEYTYGAAANEPCSYHVKKAPGFRWQLIVDDVTYNMGDDIVVVNPTMYYSKPLVKIDMDLSGPYINRAAFTINGTQVAIVDSSNTLAYSTAYFDCESGDFYALDVSGNAVNLNGYLQMKDSAGNTVHEFPALVPGENDVSFSSDAWLSFVSPALITLKPRWLTL